MRRAAFGFGAAVVVFGVFLFVFDAGSIWTVLQGVRLTPFALGLLATFGAVACWAESMRRVLVATGGHLSPSRGFAAYGAGMFAKQVLPMGNVGGVPIMAYAIDREAGIEFNRSLAVVTVGDFLGLVSSLLLALVGVAYVLVQYPGSRLLRAATVGVAAFAVALVSVAVLLVYRRGLLRYAVLGIARFLRGSLGRVSARVEARLSPDRVDASVGRYFETFDAARSDRTSLGIAAAVSLVGWTLFAVPMYTSALAVGEHVPFGLVLFVVPVGAVASMLPLPGGIGGVEFAVGGMLVAMTGVDLAVAGAMVVLYRLSVYWFLVLIGGACVLVSAVDVSAISGEVAAGEDLPAEPEP